jgi:spermidine synthase
VGEHWFSETCAEMGSKLSFNVKKQLHEEKTPYQTIAIYETTHFGKLMTIDGFVMLTTLDNFLYHEMLSHWPLFTHPHPEHIVIIGGGDCGTLREVLKHDTVQSAHLIDIDERVTRLAEQYFPELCVSNTDPRATLSFIDGIQWVAEQAASKPQSVDLIIVDSTDPVGPGEGLFTTDFYQHCFNLLKPDGLLVQQSESPLYHKPLMQRMRHNLHTAGFHAFHTATFPQPCYPSGWWSATLAGKHAHLPMFRTQAATNKSFKTQYYNTEIHHAALATPECLTDL